MEILDASCARPLEGGPYLFSAEPSLSGRLDGRVGAAGVLDPADAAFCRGGGAALAARGRAYRDLAAWMITAAIQPGR